MLATSVLASAVLSLAFAAPFPDPEPVPQIPCSTSFHYNSYTINSQQQIYTNSFVGGVSVSSGNSVSYSEGYSIGFTVTVGGSLGINFGDIASLGITASVSETTTTSTTEGANIPCPSGGAWTCAALITPSYQEVQGEAYTDYAAGCGSAHDNGAYTALLPIQDGNNIAVINVVACACPDFNGSTDPGAPQVCPSNCGSA